jgi:hypothetical protein
MGRHLDRTDPLAQEARWRDWSGEAPRRESRLDLLEESVQLPVE